jgi:hypothetical protein
MTITSLTFGEGGDCFDLASRISEKLESTDELEGSESELVPELVENELDF